jgi:hypothetical protein
MYTTRKGELRGTTSGNLPPMRVLVAYSSSSEGDLTRHSGSAPPSALPVMDSTFRPRVGLVAWLLRRRLQGIESPLMLVKRMKRRSRSGMLSVI